MPLFQDIIFGWLTSFAIKVLKCGLLPRHIAFILDGNRRFAKKTGIEKKEGHRLGAITARKAVMWCLDLEITELSMYAFSTDNFRRSEEEIRNLMIEIEDNIHSFFKEKEDFTKNHVCLRALGDLTLLPVSLQRTLAKLILITRNNTRLYFNICIAYSSREEMSNAVREIAGGVNKGLLTPSDITEELYTACFYASNPKAVDLLIRTSGEVRLSDFLLWQSSDSVLYFSKKQWPEFSIKDLLASVLYYQHSQRIMKRLNQTKPKLRYAEGHIKEGEPKDFSSPTSSTSCAVDSRPSYQAPSVLDTEAEERRKTFLSYLDMKRLKQLEDMSAGLTEQRKPYFFDIPRHDNETQ